MIDIEGMTIIVEGWADMVGEDPVGRDFITKALERIAEELEEVEVYVNGAPAPRSVYRIAKRLQNECVYGGPFNTR